MEELITKLLAMEKDLSHEKGGLSLFALFLREDSPDKWDLVVSAQWLSQDKKLGLVLLAKELSNRLTTQELLKVSRIVPIDINNPQLKSIHKALNVEHSIVEMRDSNFFGLMIKHAYFFASRKDISLQPNETKNHDQLQPNL